MSKFALLTGFLAVLVVSAFVSLREDEAVRATNSTGEIVVVGDSARDAVEQASLPQSIRSVSDLSQVPESAAVLILDQNSLVAVSRDDPEALRAQILDGVTIVAIDVPVQDLQNYVQYSEVRRLLGIRPEDDKDIAVRVPSVPFYSYINIDYEPASKVSYGGGGQRAQTSLEQDIGRFLDLPAVRDDLRRNTPVGP